MKQRRDENIPNTKIPKPVVGLVGEDGNVFAIMGAVTRALRRAGAPAEVCSAFVAEATASDYDGALRAAMKYAEVE